MKTKICLLASIVLLACSHADILLTSGQIYTLDISEISEWVAWSSPDYPSYNDYSFTIGFNNDLYNSDTDELRIRLYEEPTDTTPYLTQFEPGQLALNILSSSNVISQTSTFGTLWHDFTGKLEVEVYAGRVQLDYVRIGLGPGSSSLTAQVDAIPEPSSFGLLVIGAGLLVYRHKKHRTKKFEPAWKTSVGKVNV